MNGILATTKLSLSLILLLSIGIVSGSDAGSPPARPDRLETIVRQYVVDNGPWNPKDVDVHVTPLPAAASASGTVNYRVIKPTRGVIPGLQNFLIAAVVDGKEVARSWIKAEVRVFGDVLVSAYPLAHHETVSADKVRLERRDISSVSARPFSRIEDVEGLEAARAVEVNEVLTQKSLERPTIVRRGSAVTLVYESNSLKVETPGVADEGGKAGELIQVKNLSSGKLLRGLVLNGRTVRIN